MVDKKITQLNNITGANLASNDEFVVVDISADETKAITRTELFKSIQTYTASPSYAPTRAEAILLNVPAAQVVLFVRSDVGLLDYKDDPAGTALVTAGGRTWSPSGEVSVLHFGNRSEANNSPIIQAAVDYMFSTGRGHGGVLHIPAGSWPCASTVTIDYRGKTGYPNTNNYGLQIRGAGKRATNIKAQTSGMSIFKVIGDRPLTTASYAYSELLVDLSLSGNSVPSRSTYGVEIVDIAYAGLTRVGGFNMLAPVKLEGMLSSTFTNCDFRENTYAVRGAAGQSHCNALTFIGTKINNATKRGIEILGGCSGLSFFGGTIEDCGVHGDLTSGGIYIEGSGSQGEVALTVEGTYIESNQGGFDISINEIGGNRVLATLTGANLQRITVDSYPVHNIITTGKVTLTTVGCAFSKGNTYVPNAARPYISMGVGGWHNSIGDRFEDATEAPRRDAQLSSAGYVLGVLGAGVTAELPRGWQVQQVVTGVFRVLHFLGHEKYTVVATADTGNNRIIERVSRAENSFQVKIVNSSGFAAVNDDFGFILTQYGGAT